MIKIGSKVEKTQKNFWNNCLFHPTDAVEDAWGKRILDKMAEDKAINTVRIYTMFEDIVYVDEDGTLQYDFRVSDLRIDYLLEKGYNLILAYGGMPDCIASSVANKSSMSKNKTRYKGKMWNSAPPKDYALWEEICYAYTKHNIERYGIETVSQWYCQCHNEPDGKPFFLSEYPESSENAFEIRLPLYCKLYEAFEKGLKRASDKVKIGGPALARFNSFLGGFLDYVKEKNLRLDFISVHNYGTEPHRIKDGSRPVTVCNEVEMQQGYTETIAAHGFSDTPVIVDEWGFSTGGFQNVEECPDLIARETEMFSAYFAKLIHEFVYSDFKIDLLAICLSGQHEMVTDFSGFRNFFTLNFIKKPIYNAYILASKLGESLLTKENNRENIFVVPTKNEKEDYAILISYSDKYMTENLPEIEETVEFEQDISDKTVTIWCIDKEHTNPYRMFEKMGVEEPDEAQLKLLKEEGKMKPLKTQKGSEKISLKLTPNATFLVTVEG